MPMTRNVPIQRRSHTDSEVRQDPVAIEFPLTLHLDGEELVTLLCSPEGMEHLAVGFLKSEGLIARWEDLDTVTLDSEAGSAWVTLKAPNPLARSLMGRRTRTTGCARGITFYNVLDTIRMTPVTGNASFPFSALTDGMKAFNGASPVFRETGGVHSCALYDGSRILTLWEDIGRHNALDKLLGEALKEHWVLGDKALLTSGRVSSEMLLKTAGAGIPVLVSRSAPTDLAIREAEQLGVTLVGFVRGNAGNVYAHPERISNR